MQLSVIILNYNVRYFLEQCLLSVQDALVGIDSEIIVVDNNSSDDSCQMVKNNFPEIQLIENKENTGFPKGNNIGVEKAKGEYICILNPDTVVAEDTFSKILEFAKSKSNLGIIGCKLIDGTGNFLPESKRGTPTPWVAFTKIFGLYKWFPNSTIFNRYYAQHLNENQTGEVEILVGAFMILKRELYLEIGGFDENCFMYSDDIDLSYMALQNGKSNYYFHETTVIHYKGESTSKDKTYMNRFQEAMNFFYKKHFKVSLFFSLFMKIGITVFSFFKMFQSKTISKINPENYFLLSDDIHLKNNIENSIKKSVEIIDLKQINSIQKNNQSELIFDNNQLKFKEIINCMIENKNRNTTFKILPKNTNFLIGSNNSNDRGEVILLV